MTKTGPPATDISEKNLVETETSQSGETNLVSDAPQTQVSKHRAMPLSFKQFEAAALGSSTDFYLSVTESLGGQALAGVFLEMDEAELFSAFHRKNFRIEVHRSESTRIIM